MSEITVELGWGSICSRKSCVTPTHGVHVTVNPFSGDICSSALFPFDCENVPLGFAEPLGTQTTSNNHKAHLILGRLSFGLEKTHLFARRKVRGGSDVDDKSGWAGSDERECFDALKSLAGVTVNQPD